MRRIGFLFVVVLAAACAPRAELVRGTEVAQGATLRPIFVSTTRAVSDEGRLEGDREATPKYMRIGIAVPPERSLGSVEWPQGDIEPAEDFLATDVEIYGGSAEFRAALSAAFGEEPRASRDAIIYVHGFNNNFADGVLRIAQLMHDFELPGVAVHYSWPSAANPLGYAHDRDSALFARDGLETLIEEIEAAGARRIILVAHSMGAFLSMETMRQMAIAAPGSVKRRIGGVILISPDVDPNLFRRQAARIGDLPQPFGIFISRRDRALALSARLSGERQRIGNVDRLDELADLDVTVVDVTNFSRGSGHFTIGTSPALIEIFRRAGDINTAFSGDAAGQTGLIPGTVLTVQSATEIILAPVQALTGGQ